MSVFFWSLAGAVLQAGTLLLLARVLGPGEYAGYSLIFAASGFLTGLFFEWLRQSIPRFFGIRQGRVQRWLFTTIRNKTDLLAILIAVISLLVGLISYFLGFRDAAKFIVVLGVLVSASGVADATLMYARFSSSNSHFNGLSLTRTAGSGIAALVCGLLWHSAFAAALAFALASLGVTACARRIMWRQENSSGRSGAIRALAAYGLLASVSTINTNFTFVLSRLGLRSVVPAADAGVIFLTLDLATRGVIVLGQALNSADSKAIFFAAKKSAESARLQFKKSGEIFLVVWGSICIAGCALSMIIAEIVLQHNIPVMIQFICWINICAVILIGFKLYCTDVYLLAIGQVKCVAESSIILLLCTLAVVLTGWLINQPLGGYALPMSTVLTALIYFLRARVPLSILSGDVFSIFGISIFLSTAAVMLLAQKPFLMAGAVVSIATLVIAVVAFFRRSEISALFYRR